MNKHALLLAIAVCALLSGCAATTMNNDEIIVEAIKCEDAGLEWRQLYDYRGQVRNVLCVNPMRRKG